MFLIFSLEKNFSLPFWWSPLVKCQTAGGSQLCDQSDYWYLMGLTLRAVFLALQIRQNHLLVLHCIAYIVGQVHKLSSFQLVPKYSSVLKEITAAALVVAYMWELIFDTTEHLWCICCGILIWEYWKWCIMHWKDHTSNNWMCVKAILISLLLAMLAFDAKHHAPATHLACLGQPRLGGKPA